jgi:predicted transcriptional regulator
MKINEFFERLEKEFGLTPYDYCRIKPISYATLKKYIKGEKPQLHTAKVIERITGGRVTLEDMGFEAADKNDTE